MRLTLVPLGHTFDVSLEPTETTASDANALDGGTTVSERVEAGEGELHMGFTLGLESGDE